MTDHQQSAQKEPDVLLNHGVLGTRGVRRTGWRILTLCVLQEVNPIILTIHPVLRCHRLIPGNCRLHVETR